MPEVGVVCSPMPRAWIATIGVALTSVAALGAEQRSGALDLGALLSDVVAAVERYYASAQSIICLEDVHLQTLGFDLLSDQTSARRLTYELRVAWESTIDGSAPAASVQRQLIKVNNRAP